MKNKNDGYEKNTDIRWKIILKPVFILDKQYI